MPRNFFTLLEEFSCLRPQDLLCIPPLLVKGFLGLWEFSWHHLTPNSKPSGNQKVKSRKYHHTMAIWKWQSQARIHCQIPAKSILVTTKEPSTNIHIPCMSKPAGKSHMKSVTYKYFHWSYLIIALLFFPCSSLLFLSFPCLITFFLLLVRFFS